MLPQAWETGPRRRDRYCRRGSSAQHGNPGSRGLRQSLARTAGPEAASTARALLPPLLRAGAEQSPAEHGSRAQRPGRKRGSPSTPALPAAQTGPARRFQLDPPDAGRPRDSSPRLAAAPAHQPPGAGLAGAATRGIRHRGATAGTLVAAAGSGVMAAAATSPLQPGGHVAEFGADPAASEVASSALRSLAGLAGQVSAGRAEGEARGRAGPGRRGPRTAPGSPRLGDPERGALLLLPGVRGPPGLQG